MLHRCCMMHKWRMLQLRAKRLQLPAAENEDDCGAFLCCGALHAMYDKEPLFTRSDIAAFRGHIAWRLLRGDDWDKPE